MMFHSLKTPNLKANFREAVINGIAPDKGLYFPDKISPLSPSFIDNLEKLSNKEIAFESIKQFVDGAIDDVSLQNIIKEVIDFEFPMISVEPNVFSLELFHGPTLAFKDVGARFMARCLNHFIGDKEKVTVLVATSGDTGSAVANGFYNIKNIDVVILYPKGKVSEIQEKQLTTLGKNITAIEVEGSFDDCQAMVKRAFVDESITKIKKLTSANSINVSRWLPQMWYYFFAYKSLLNKDKPLVVSVPSGNFGNICAGILAREIGLPITRFIAANNENNIISRFLKSGNYEVKQTIPTISNAMDVGNPSNFIRIQQIFNNNKVKLKDVLTAFSYSDEETRSAMKKVYQNGYILDPHGAVGYLGLKEYMSYHSNVQGIFLETAHPIKFAPIVEQVIESKLEVPNRIKGLLDKEKNTILIKSYNELRKILIE